MAPIFLLIFLKSNEHTGGAKCIVALLTKILGGPGPGPPCSTPRTRSVGGHVVLRRCSIDVYRKAASGGGLA